MLIILAGLPGVGKTSLARELARRLVAVHVHIDAIEGAIRQSPAHADVPTDDVGYQVGYAVAEGNLRLGHTVIADSVNPWPETRAAWRAVAERANVRAVEIEIVCSDPAEHERRVTTRDPEPSGVRPVTWQQVLARDYRHWQLAPARIDTALKSPEAAAGDVMALIAAREAAQ